MSPAIDTDGIPDEVVEEFEAELDAYIEDWKDALRAELKDADEDEDAEESPDGDVS